MDDFTPHNPIRQGRVQRNAEQEMTEQECKDLAMTFPELTRTIRFSTRPSDDTRHIQAVQTKYLIRDLMDGCMMLMYLIYNQMANMFRHFPSMAEEGTLGVPAYGIVPTFRGLTSATKLWRWEIENLTWFYNNRTLEELPHGFSPYYDEFCYVLRDSSSQVAYEAPLLASFPLPQRRTRGTYEMMEWQRVVRTARNHTRNGGIRRPDARNARNFEYWEALHTAEECNATLNL